MIQSKILSFENLANDTKRLLDKLGVKEKYGSTGWGLNGTSAVFQENTHHRSNSQVRHDEFYTPELKKMVEKRYSRDYDVI